MPTPEQDHIGTRIAHQRKLRRLSGRELARRAGISYSLLSKVESGHKPASADVVAAVARTLSVSRDTLTGQPYVTELQQDRLADLVHPMRIALDLYDLGDDPDLSVRPSWQLVAAADDLCATVRATHLHKAADTLPALVAELTAAVYRTPGSELWTALGSAYRSTHDVAVKLGYTDLATVALDRMGWAAEKASNPLLSAVRQYKRALGYFREGECHIGQRLIGAGRDHLATAGDTRAALAVAGQLHLGAAVLAARARDAAGTELHLAQAEEHAARTGEAGRVLWLSFGPTNVTLHRTSTLIEFHRFGEAVEVSGGVHFPDGWSTSRAAHHHVHRSYALMETKRYDQALGEMVTARRIAPEQTRYYAPARETINALVRHQRATPDTLTNLAHWVGL
ncbi:hypothetical protein SRB5_53140 [Streptomyces sp. RB5]|uniref:HTH cro/C1-type domain-containing protein n=1 Tax=Streptomyces smaragdinus TaxID=2585196 RepID=A0A7K0CNR7_9ACTN|nr:helix-turn-helix transcriptional regulator [Streptomyces smaragdinus]MQY15136.1 hypothetical protein [Streptomyces smaragdinus]